MVKKFLQAVFIIWIVTLLDSKAGGVMDGIFGLSENLSNSLMSYTEATDRKVIDSSSTVINSSLSTCDTGLALASADPFDAAKAIDICKMADGPEDWGLISASWVMADGSSAVSDPDYALGHGILPAFGSHVTARNGERLLALSSGTARQPGDPGYVDPSGGLDNGFKKGYYGNHPAGFPKVVFTCIGECPLTELPYDDAALVVSLRVPWFANGFSFDFKFYMTDFQSTPTDFPPPFLCSKYNDWFVAILDPAPEGHLDGNIAFDPNGNPVRNNEDLLSVCTANPQVECYHCYSGSSELEGTGYENHAASGWLNATATVKSGTVITLRFAIYDSGDGSYDSTVLIDNFQWLESPNLCLPMIFR